MTGIFWCTFSFFLHVEFVVSIHSMCIRNSTDYCLGSYCSISLHASLCSLLQSPKLEKHFDVSSVLICSAMSELLMEIDGRISRESALVWFESCVLRLVILDRFFTISRTRESFPCCSSGDTVVCTVVEEANLSWFSALFIHHLAL